MRFQGMRLRFWLAYLCRRTPWDTNVTPPELVETVERTRNLAPRRALDLGCGTGTNAIYLAENGWDAVGIDFVDQAIHGARKKAERAGTQVEFLAGDVTRLDQITELCGAFDLIVDIGCFHSLSPAGQTRYAAGLADRLRAGGIFLLYTWLSHHRENGDVDRFDMHALGVGVFGPEMRLDALRSGKERGRPSAWCWFRKTGVEN